MKKVNIQHIGTGWIIVNAVITDAENAMAYNAPIRTAVNLVSICNSLKFEVLNKSVLTEEFQKKLKYPIKRKPRVINTVKPKTVPVSGFTLEGFTAYLERTLIPDLKESGSTATAEDFETAVNFLKQLSK